MDIAKYLESRGWKYKGDTGYKNGKYSLYIFGNGIVDINNLYNGMHLFVGRLLTEEKADIIIEALGIT